MPLHEGQKRFIQALVDVWFSNTPRSIKIFILTCANRWGKSVEIACIQCWFLFYKIGLPDGDQDSWRKTEYRTANIAPHSALTEPVFKTMHQILTSSFSVRDPDSGNLRTNDCLIEWWYLKDKTINTPPYRQHFDNGSYIEHRSLGGDQGGSLQGKPYGVITYDEGGRSDHLQTEIDDAILARLFDMQGPLMILSTPSTESKSNLAYYRLYQNGLVGLNNTYTMTGSLRDNSFFSEEQIQAQYDLLKDNPLKDQMLEGKFIWGGDTLFDTASILDAQDASLDNGVRYEAGHRYVVGVDTAIGHDEMVYQVVDFTTKPYRLVRTIAAKGNSKSPQMHLNDFLDLFDSYNQDGTCYVLLETWNGEAVRFYMDLPANVQSVTHCYGAWKPSRVQSDNQNQLKPRNNAAKKADILLALKKSLSAREIKIAKNDQALQQQLSIYREDDKGLPTDRLMALAFCCYLINELAPAEIPLAWQSIEW